MERTTPQEMFRVPQRAVPVIVELQDGEQRRGNLYAAASGPGGGPARLIDRLNDEGERFLPLTDGERGWLLNKSWIVRVAVAADHQAVELGPDAPSRRVGVRLALAVGAAAEGEIAYTMPPDKQRLLDFMNVGQRFVPLRNAGGVWLINRDFVTEVTTL